MFEHFTEHAKNVIQLEGLEAQRMHHEHLGTEHLLAALVREPEGHGHRALAQLGVTLKQVREALAKQVETGPDTAVPDALHQTPRFRHVIEMAIEEARLRKHDHIGTEHLLLALLNEPEGVAFKTLNTLNLTPEAVRNEVDQLLETEKV
jgi:ATP-dependent Clp protease ATP-binding subunit ClpC